MERIGVNDNFTDIGGDSLAAVETSLRISEDFHVTFPLYMFFQAPTVAELAAAFERLIGG